MNGKEKKSYHIADYNDGYHSCEAEKPFDEAQSDAWKEGYHDKEKERLIRSVRYHLDHVSGKIDRCFYLMNNDRKSSGTEYRCYYYGKHGDCCNKMLQDFLRLYTNQQ